MADLTNSKLGLETASDGDFAGDKKQSWLRSGKRNSESFCEFSEDAGGGDLKKSGVSFHQSKNRKWAVALNMAFAVGVFGVGCVYAFASRFMPYHRQIVGLTWEEIPERLRELHLAFQNGAGALAMAFSLLFAAVNWFAFRPGKKWAQVALPVSGLTIGLPLLVIVRRLSTETGAGTPMIPLAIGIGMLIAAAILSIIENR